MQISEEMHHLNAWCKQHRIEYRMFLDALPSIRQSIYHVPFQIIQNLWVLLKGINIDHCKDSYN